LFAPLPLETRRALEDIPALIDKTFPLPGRFRSALPAEVAELSRLLTSARGERSLSYLSRPKLLSAYLRYFLPWNLYRLCRLLPGLDIPLVAHNEIIDLGCGPLTFAAALWISRPDLRGLPLEFRCIDRSGPALEAGKKFFAALTGEGCQWKIRTVKADIFTGKAGGSAALVCAVNVLNEAYSRIPRNDTAGLCSAAEKSAALLAGFTAADASMLIVEPGVPQSGQFISLLRDALIARNCPPHAPCPHCGPCPLPSITNRVRNGVAHNKGQVGGKGRWCHFAFETEDAPKGLHKLSAAAGIPKERAVLSFLFAAGSAQPAAEAKHAAMPVRIISDAFPLPQFRMGRYGCSEQGLTLIAGERKRIENMASGTLVSCRKPDADSGKNTQQDPKSGALVVEVMG
jgi:ribosomal protein RSM22 (predicted rRNA methylase)